LGAAAATTLALLLTPVREHWLPRLRPLLLLLLGEGPLLPFALLPCLVLADPSVLRMLLLTLLPVWGPVVLQGVVLVPAGTAMRRPKATTYAWAAAGGW